MELEANRPRKWLAGKTGALVELCLITPVVILFILQPTMLILLLAAVSLRLRGHGWRDIGLARPESWRKTLVWVLGASLLWAVLGLLVVEPLVARLAGTPNLEQLASVEGNSLALLGWLLLNWTLVAFGEEIVYRGYLMNRFADLFGRTRLGWALGLCLSAVLFGFAHQQQGLAGMLERVVSGLILGGLYLASRRNLWPSILVHGLTNTLGFLAIYWR